MASEENSVLCDDGSGRAHPALEAVIAWMLQRGSVCTYAARGPVYH